MDDHVAGTARVDAQDGGASAEGAQTDEEAGANGMLYGMIFGPTLGGIVALLSFGNMGAGIAVGLPMGIAAGATYGHLRHRRGSSVRAPE